MSPINQSFAFREIDQEGLATLDAIAEAHRFNRWMYETIKPWCKGDILEVGSGIGNISNCFLEDGFTISLSDLRQNYLDHLHESFHQHPGLKATHHLDLVHPDFNQAYASLLGSFDTVFALNVVEHIQDDVLAMSNIKALLKPGGNVVILVPAYQSLYNRFDKELEHYRRYTKSSLSEVFQKAGFKILHKQHFNAMGIPGWYVSGKLQGNKTIPKGQMKFYNIMVPVFRIVDSILFCSVGLSVVMIGRKEGL